jgi:tRNA pseudouridine38-40 synthase
LSHTVHNIRLLIEYDGTAYAGWQRQAGQPSVQGAIEQALHKITGEPTALHKLTVAGRTDAGVHALGQVANFATLRPMQARRFAPALNFWLPTDIRIHQADAVPGAFDARRWARGKRYRYRIYVGPHPLAVGRHAAWHIRRPLDLTAMRAAAAMLVGEHDFESFRSAHCDAAHAVRRMHGISIEVSPRPPVGQFVDIVLHADAFCRHMCRIIAGSLAAVGTGAKPTAWIEAALAMRRRQSAGMTAPPGGLTLLHVAYDPLEPPFGTAS